MWNSNKTDFGMPTLVELPDIIENARVCSSLGLRFIELNMNLPEYQAECLEQMVFFKTAERYGIYYTIHLDENVNVCDFNASVADAWLDTVTRTIGIAAQLKIPILNMHMNKGVYFTLPDRKVYLYEKYQAVYINKIRRFRDLCERLIGDQEIRIAIENTDGYTDFQQTALNCLLESPVFVLTWDIGHSHTAEGSGDEAYILGKENRLRHFHIHDAAGVQNHLALGTGDIPLKERLRTAQRYHCRCVIETKTVAALQQSVRWLKEQVTDSSNF